MINEARLNQTFCDLVRIYAPSGNERAVFSYLEKALKKLGARVTEDGAGQATGAACGNLIAVFPANAEGLPGVAFTAHMDCVEKCEGIEPVLENGVYHSAGDTILGGDDKAGAAAILEALTVMKETMIPHGKILAVFTVQEESGLGGSRHFDGKYAEGIDFGYVLDVDGAPGTIVNAGPGEISLTCTMHGRAAHAGMAPEKGVNAIKMAAAGLSRMESGRIDAETTCNVGLIEGGLATNIVPESCTIRAEARSRNHEKLLALAARMTEALKSAEQDFPGGRAEITTEEIYQSFRVGEDAPCFRLFRAACAEAGFPVEVKSTGGGSDANWFNRNAFPAVLLGVGMTDFHTPEETLREEDLVNSAKLVYAIIEAESHYAGH